MVQDNTDEDAVITANLGFYDAFSSLDIRKMDKVWEQSDRVLCVHPGWAVLGGWEKIRKSWQDIFYNTTLMQFNITSTQVVVQGDSAWVSCVENITSVLDGRASNFTVQATNIFVRAPDGGWLVVHHHASG